MEKWPMIQSLEMNGDGMSDSIRRNGHRKMSHICDRMDNDHAGIKFRRNGRRWDVG